VLFVFVLFVSSSSFEASGKTVTSGFPKIGEDVNEALAPRDTKDASLQYKFAPRRINARDGEVLCGADLGFSLFTLRVFEAFLMRTFGFKF
jgi:hypothetical protein